MDDRRYIWAGLGLIFVPLIFMAFLAVRGVNAMALVSFSLALVLIGVHLYLTFKIGAMLAGRPVEPFAGGWASAFVTAWGKAPVLFLAATVARNLSAVLVVAKWLVLIDLVALIVAMWVERRRQAMRD